MSKLLRIALLLTSLCCAQVRADVCKTVSGLVGSASAAVGLVGGSLKILGVAAVEHSSGAMILSGTTGYIANTLGPLAGGAAVVTNPFFIGGAVLAGGAAAGAWIYCDQVRKLAVR